LIELKERPVGSSICILNYTLVLLSFTDLCGSWLEN